MGRGGCNRKNRVDCVEIEINADDLDENTTDEEQHSRDETIAARNIRENILSSFQFINM